MMNKKADIPTFLLFAVAIILIVVALFAFVSFKNDFSERSGEFSRIMSDIDFQQQYILTVIKNLAKKSIQNPFPTGDNLVKTQFRELVKEKSFFYFGVEDFRNKIDRWGFEFSQENEQWRWETQENVPVILVSEKGTGKVVREMRICMVFDEKGDFVGECD